VARIRAVKIGFFRNEDLALFSFPHRLLFQGLWLLADRRGLLEDRPRRIHADLFPFDPKLDVDVMLDQLASGENPFIQRYVGSDGRRYIAVINFSKHQRPHHTEPESTFPDPSETGTKQHTPDKDGETPDIHGEDPEDHGEPQDGREGKGREGNEEGKGKGKGEAHAPMPPSVLQALWNDGTHPPIPKCAEMTPKRRVSAIARLHEHPSRDYWRGVIARINASAFCRGENDRAWVATMDWLLRPDTSVRVLEGKYDNRVAHLPATDRAARTLSAAERLIARQIDQQQAHQQKALTS
jgi:hypothetical protein